MEIRVIKSRSEYELALKKVSDLMDKNPSVGSKEENQLELLAVLIRDYEQRIIEPIEADPIEAIKFRMEQMELSQKEMTPYLGSISKVSEVLSGKRGLSLSMIRKLHEGLGIPLESLVVKQASRRPLRKRVFRRRKPRKKALFTRSRTSGSRKRRC